MASARKFPALHAAVPRRRRVSRHRLPQGAENLRPRLLRRPHRLRHRRPRVSRRDVFDQPGQSDRRAAAVVVRRHRAVVRGGRSPARKFLACRLRRAGRRRALHAAGPSRYSEARRLRLQGRRLCPQISRQHARLRARLAVRLYGGLFQLLPPLRAGAFR